MDKERKRAILSLIECARRIEGRNPDDEDFVEELKILCRELDPRRLFFWTNVPTVEEAEALMKAAAQLRGGNR